MSLDLRSSLSVFSTVISKYYLSKRLTRDSSPCSMRSSLRVSRAFPWYGASLSVWLNSLYLLLIIWRTTSTSASTNTRFSKPWLKASFLLRTAMHKGVYAQSMWAWSATPKWDYIDLSWVFGGGDRSPLTSCISVWTSIVRLGSISWSSTLYWDEASAKIFYSG